MKFQMQEEKVFKDPVHKYIYVQDRLIWDLINTKEFQRLRRIRQLGTSYLTFHGAEHSRFSHSLGVYEITRKIISQFERNQYDDWPDEEKLLCLCAALLHDVGHGPFSHSIEAAFDMHHEEWSCAIILGDTEINETLRSISHDFPHKVAQVIRKQYDKEIVVSLISSQLDADRMDYLLRDAYYTGVNYGTFDLDRILRVMRPYKDYIVVKESGMHAVEDYLMSRYQMYWQIYFHPVTRSSEIILKKIFDRAKYLYLNDYHFQFMMEPIVKLMDHSIDIEHYLMLDEAYLQMVMQQWINEKDEVLSDLCNRFLYRKLFKYVAFEPEQWDENIVDELRMQLIALNLDPTYYLHMDVPSDMPYDVYRPGEKDDKLPILIMNDRGQLIEISQKSEIIRSISGQRRVGMQHLYFPGEQINLHSIKH